MDNEKEIVLYYPYIDIDDASLIKTAALYWDEIQTIVPYDEYEYYDKHGSLPSNGLDPYATPISKEAKAAGFLKPRFVNPEDESDFDMYGDEAVKRTCEMDLRTEDKLQALIEERDDLTET